jgi:hypothetical protein
LFLSSNRLSKPEQCVDMVWCCTAFIEYTIFIDLFVDFLCYYWYFYFYYGLHTMVIILILSLHYQLNFSCFLVTCWRFEYYIILYLSRVSGWLLIYTIERFVQPYYVVNKLYSMKWWFLLCTRQTCLVWLPGYYSVISMKQQSLGKHFAP